MPEMTGNYLLILDFHMLLCVCHRHHRRSEQRAWPLFHWLVGQYTSVCLEVTRAAHISGWEPRAQPIIYAGFTT